MKKLPILRNAKQIISINELKKKFIILFSILIIFQIQAYPISGKYLKTSYEYPNVILSKKSLKNLESISSALYQLSITGIVKDSDGTPLPGASVLEKGTTNGVITDFDGNFKIDIKNANAILIVSYLGFQQREVSAAGQTNISIMLDEDSSKLDEVIVTGYTSERKSDLTGAVSIIQVDETTNQPLASVNELVQGRSAGVDVLRSNAPGGNAAIRIRGFSTIRNNDPLYVVDGVPTTTGINLINPNDIESLQVLKDASSASIYGSRAANGVVVITTKKGRNGKIDIAYDGYGGAMTVMRLPDLANASEYGNGLWQAFENDGITPANDIYGSGSTPVIPAFLDAENTIPSADTDWLDAVFNTALVTSHNLSFASGTEASNSFFSLNYFKQDGILKNTGFNRYTFRANTSFDLGDKITVGENFSLSFSNNTDVNTNTLLGSPVYSAFRMQSIVPIRNINGDFTGYPLNDIQTL